MSEFRCPRRDVRRNLRDGAHGGCAQDLVLMSDRLRWLMRRSHLRFTAALVVTACTLLAGGVLLGVPTNGSAESSRAGLVVDIADRPPITSRLELETREVRAGASLRGDIIVRNDSGAEIVIQNCSGLPYLVGLEGGSARQSLNDLSCGGYVVTVPIGESRWPVQIMAIDDACIPGDSSAIERCLDGGGPPALPPGSYRTFSQAASPNLPLPDPVEVDVE